MAFCGIDGSGKTTQILELKKNLEQQGLNVQTTKVKFHDLEVLYKLSDDMFGDPYLYGKLPADVVRLGIAYDFAYHYLSLEKQMRTDEQPGHLQDVKSAYEFFLNEQSNVMRINGNLEIKQISNLIEKRAMETIKNIVKP